MIPKPNASEARPKAARANARRGSVHDAGEYPPSTKITFFKCAIAALPERLHERAPNIFN
jgi:hypothetical protein